MISHANSGRHGSGPHQREAQRAAAAGLLSGRVGGPATARSPLLPDPAAGQGRWKIEGFRSTNDEK